MTEQKWNALYRCTLRASESINWEFLGGVLLLGGLWFVILFGFSMVIG